MPAAAARANIARWACTAFTQMRARPQVIKKLLKKEGVSKQEMDQAFAQRVNVMQIKIRRPAQHSEVNNTIQRGKIQDDVYQKVEHYAAVSALGGDAKVPFLHPVGCALLRSECVCPSFSRAADADACACPPRPHRGAARHGVQE
jgi:hypothetical protein